MSKDFALLVDYKYCSGCHSCEVACKNEHHFGLGVNGIKLLEMEPMKIGEGMVDAWDWIYLPVPTALCDHCAARLEKGEEPTCVKHCQAFCLEYGTLDEMQARAAELDRKVCVYLP